MKETKNRKFTIGKFENHLFYLEILLLNVPYCQFLNIDIAQGMKEI